MATKQKTAIAISKLAMLALTLIAGGCGSFLETNQAACKRAGNSLLACASTFFDLPSESLSLVSEACEGVPETIECRDWSALADCVTSVSCLELTTDPQTIVECNTIQARLEINGCFPPAN